jgi:hypothetical protein
MYSRGQSSRRQHAKPIETVFPGPLQLIRQFTAPFSVQKCYEQMEQSIYYRTRVLQRPDGMKDWVRLTTSKYRKSNLQFITKLE